MGKSCDDLGDRRRRVRKDLGDVRGTDVSANWVFFAECRLVKGLGRVLRGTVSVTMLFN